MREKSIPMAAAAMDLREPKPRSLNSDVLYYSEWNSHEQPLSQTPFSLPSTLRQSRKQTDLQGSSSCPLSRAVLSSGALAVSWTKRVDIMS